MRAELGQVHPHMLRVAFIMAALDAGVPLRDVLNFDGSPFTSWLPCPLAADDPGLSQVRGFDSLDGLDSIQ